MSVEIKIGMNFISDVYLAICTIKQHYSYFEYYDMNYEVNDVSAMQQIYPFEIVSKKLSLEH